MKEVNRLNEPVIKGTVLNESFGPVCPTSAANKTNYIAAFHNFKALGIELSASTLRWQSAQLAERSVTVARGKKAIRGMDLLWKCK